MMKDYWTNKDKQDNQKKKWRETMEQSKLKYYTHKL